MYVIKASKFMQTSLIFQVQKTSRELFPYNTYNSAEAKLTVTAAVELRGEGQEGS